MAINRNKSFYSTVGQTSPFPLGLEVSKADGIYIYDINGNKYIDLISGIAVSNLGHNNKKIVKAIQEQAAKYIHTMVYGEHIQSPQVDFAHKLCAHLPDNLNTVFYTNSGSEAVEGAIKLAKRYTKRYEIVVCRNGYHGNTHGAQSLMDYEYLSMAYRPFVPGIRFIEYDNLESLEGITNRTAAVITETIQGDIGIKVGSKEFLKALRKKCDETNSLLVFDEIQTGFGRTGKLFAFEHYGVTPDVLLIAKAMGGGMPCGGLVADNNIMKVLSDKPILGFISTFGGHPVSLAAAVSSFEQLTKSNLIEQVEKKEKLFLKNLNHKSIVDVRSKGLFIAVEFENSTIVKNIMSAAKDNGILIDSFLYNDKSIRIAPPLIISEEEILEACDKLNRTFSDSKQN